MEHSVYSPSRLKRIIECPGSVGLIDSLMITKIIGKSKSSVYAEHGTGLHKVTNKCHYDKLALDHASLDIDDKFLVTECLDYLEVLKKSIGHTSYLLCSETQVSLRQWGIPDVWGTLDYQILDPIKRHIDIIDWKFGAGVPVYSEKNPQLLAYVAGAVGWPTIIQTMTLHIVQPAIDNFSTWDLTTTELYEWVHGTLAIAINKCADDSKEFNPGIEQCRWCEVANHCQARIDQARDIAVRLFEANANLATCPEPKELVELIKLAPLVEKAINSILNYVQVEMLKGEIFDGLKLIQGRANRKWKSEFKTAEWITKHPEIDCHIPELYTSKMKSPSQLEKLVKALKKNSEYQALYEQPQGKITLVHSSDKRPAIEVQKKAIDVFADYKGPDKLE